MTEKLLAGPTSSFSVLCSFPSVLAAMSGFLALI